MQKTIDETDIGIIKILQKDGRTPNTEIAKSLGLNEATIRKRLQKLIQDKTIKIIAMGAGLGSNGLAGSISIEADFKKMDLVIQDLRKYNEIWFMVRTVGRHNLELEFFVHDMDEFNYFFKTLQHIDGILSLEHTLYTEILIEKYDWSLPVHR